MSNYEQNNEQNTSSKLNQLKQLYGKYRGMRALLLTRVSTGSQSHEAQRKSYP